jgi:hypothetical protein
MIKQLLFTLIVLITSTLNAQIKIDVVGDSWDKNVLSSLELIKQVDSTTYNFVTKNCNHIGFWNNTYSSSEGKSIYITTSEVKHGNILNIASIIVHESKHIELYEHNLHENEEECICYFFELEFLIKNKNVDLFLIDHIQKMFDKYGCEKYLK